MGENLYAINTDNGQEKWGYNFSTTTIGCISPAIDLSNNIYVFNYHDGYLYSLTDTGADASLNWTSSFLSQGSPTNPEFSSPAISNDGSTIYIAAYNLYAINTNNGQIKWQYNGISAAYSVAIAATNSTIYVSGGVYLYSITDNGQLDRTLNWQYQANDGSRYILSSPLVDINGNIYFSDSLNAYALNASGSSLWTYVFTTPGPALTAQSSPSIDSSGNLYICDGVGNLYSFIN